MNRTVTNYLHSDMMKHSRKLFLLLHIPASPTTSQVVRSKTIAMTRSLLSRDETIGLIIHNKKCIQGRTFFLETELLLSQIKNYLTPKICLGDSGILFLSDWKMLTETMRQQFSVSSEQPLKKWPNQFHTSRSLQKRDLSEPRPLRFPYSQVSFLTTPRKLQPKMDKIRNRSRSNNKIYIYNGYYVFSNTDIHIKAVSRFVTYL